MDVLEVVQAYSRSRLHGEGVRRERGFRNRSRLRDEGVRKAGEFRILSGGVGCVLEEGCRIGLVSRNRWCGGVEELKAEAEAGAHWRGDRLGVGVMNDVSGDDLVVVRHMGKGPMGG